jgi:hypothetical protein
MTEIDGHFVPTARPGVASVLVGVEIVLGRTEHGRMQTCALNEGGSIIWQCFDGLGTIDEIAADIAAEFGIDIDSARTGVVALARDAARAGFLS